MKRFEWASALVAALIIAPNIGAQAPAGARGVCNDGSYTYSATKRGACSHHGGAKQWLAATAASAATTRPDSAKATAASKSAKASAESGRVWVNTPTMVYHCPGTRWYGTTKNGSYMTESEAKAAGARPAYGKGC